MALAGQNNGILAVENGSPRFGQNSGNQPSDLVQISVRAESEDDHTFDWHAQLRLTDPIRVVANMWAEAYGVPVGAVGLDEQSGHELDLARTPDDYGWRAGSIVSVKAYPTEENLMESEGPTAVSVSMRAQIGRASCRERV